MKFEFKKLLRTFLPLLLLGLMITSCTKEDIEEPVAQADPRAVEEISLRGNLGVFNGSVVNGSGVDCDCYGPFDVIDWENADPATIEAQIEAALATLTEDELEALFTPVCTEDGEFFPNACYAECEGVTDYSVCESTEWGCDGEDFETIDCYELVFPVTGVFSDGSTVTFDNYDAYFDALIIAEEEPQLLYPFDVTDEEGNVITIESEEEWAELGVACFGIGWEWDGTGGEPETRCFIFGYPFSLSINGEVFVANNDMELFEIFDVIFNSPEPPNELYIQPVFPMNLILDDGSTITVNNDEEYYDAIIEYCD